MMESGAPLDAGGAPGLPGVGPSSQPQAVWALAGGKGGVGRSLLAANLSIQIARTGSRVVLIDLDLQGSNLHTCLGYQRLPRTLADLACGRAARLAELAVETPTAGLRLVGGLQRGDLRDDPPGFVRRVAEQIPTLSADLVILDCGSGRTDSTLAAFAEAGVGVLVTTPEPAAVESLYLFTQAYLRWRLTRALGGEAKASVEGRLREAGLDPGRAPFRAFMTRLSTLDPEAHGRIAAVVRRTRLQLLMNQVRAESDAEATASLASGFLKCFGLPLEIAGSIEYDQSVQQAVKKRRSLSQQYPNAAATVAIARAAGRLRDLSRRSSPEAAEEWEDLERLDHYRVLEVPSTATPKEVQSAYQLLRRTYDPETTCLAPLLDAPGLRDLLTRIEAAYRTLIFLESRTDYDRRLAERQAPPARPAPGSGRRDNPPLPDPPLEMAGGSPAPPEPAEPLEPAAAGSGPASTARPPQRGPGPRPVPGSGAELSRERQRLGLSLESIAETTKVRIHHLKAIEEERFGALPAGVFVRGFLKEYARCLSLAPDEVADQYMKRYRDWHESHARPEGQGAH
ncbi:MAG: helix-turn-helix domain-containing protein [Acidobacteriota bacterium]